MALPKTRLVGGEHDALADRSTRRPMGIASTALATM